MHKFVRILDKYVSFVILHKLSFAVFVNRNQTFFDPSLHTTHEKFVPKCLVPQMSYILTYVQVALATSDVPSILEIPATDEMHMKDRNQTCLSTATFDNKPIHQSRSDG